MTGMEALYPFLYAETADVAPVLRAARASTADKAHEIVGLRHEMGEQYADALIACARALAERFAAGGRLFTFGNGGSSSDAQAVAQLFLDPGGAYRPLPALSLTNDVAVLTALSNDIGFEVVFARQLAAQGTEVDIAVGLSTSGGSANVLAGFEQANRRGMLTVGFAGYEGGRMAEANTIDHLFVVPSASVHRIQEAQTTTYNVLWELTQWELTQHALT